MRVRRARPEDAAAIAAVHVRTWQGAYEHVFGVERLAGIDAERRRRIWDDALANESVDVWVAEGDEGLVGFVSIGDSRDPDADGELYAIYVLPRAWGSGAGPGLMRAAVPVLRERFASSILWVLDDNPRARRFYEREGWAADGASKTEPFLGLDVTEVRYRLGGES